jgi:hypothetical protein
MSTLISRSDGALPHQKSSPASCSTDVRNSWRDWMLTKLTGAIVHGSLLFATAPQMFPADRFVFSSCRAGVCGFGMVDSGRGSGASVPGSCRRSCAQGWQPTRTGFVFPLTFKWVFLGTSPAQDTFSPLLFLVQGVEHGCRIGEAPRSLLRSRCTIVDGKHAERRER